MARQGGLRPCGSCSSWCSASLGAPRRRVRALPGAHRGSAQGSRTTSSTRYLVQRGISGSGASELGTLEHFGRRTGTRHLTPLHPIPSDGSGFRFVVPLGEVPVGPQRARRRSLPHAAPRHVYDLDEPVLLAPTEVPDVATPVARLGDRFGVQYLVVRRFAERAGQLEPMEVAVEVEPIEPIQAAAGRAVARLIVDRSRELAGSGTVRDHGDRSGSRRSRGSPRGSRTIRAPCLRPCPRRHSRVLRRLRLRARGLGEHDPRRREGRSAGPRRVRGPRNPSPGRQPGRPEAAGDEEGVVRVTRGDASRHRSRDRGRDRLRAAGRRCRSGSTVLS